MNAIPSLYSPFRLTSLIYGGQAVWTRNWSGILFRSALNAPYLTSRT